MSLLRAYLASMSPIKKIVSGIIIATGVATGGYFLFHKPEVKQVKPKTQIEQLQDTLKTKNKLITDLNITIGNQAKRDTTLEERTKALAGIANLSLNNTERLFLCDSISPDSTQEVLVFDREFEAEDTGAVRYKQRQLKYSPERSFFYNKTPSDRDSIIIENDRNLKKALSTLSRVDRKWAESYRNGEFNEVHILKGSKIDSSYLPGDSTVNLARLNLTKTYILKVETDGEKNYVMGYKELGAAKPKEAPKKQGHIKFDIKRPIVLDKL